MNSETNRNLSNPSDIHEIEWYSDIIVSLCHSRNKRGQEFPKDALDSIRESISVLQQLEVLTLSCIVGAIVLFLFVTISAILH